MSDEKYWEKRARELQELVNSLHRRLDNSPDREEFVHLHTQITAVLQWLLKLGFEPTGNQTLSYALLALEDRTRKRFEALHCLITDIRTVAGLDTPPEGSHVEWMQRGQEAVQKLRVEIVEARNLARNRHKQLIDFHILIRDQRDKLNIPTGGDDNDHTCWVENARSLFLAWKTDRKRYSEEYAQASSRLFRLESRIDKTHVESYDEALQRLMEELQAYRDSKPNPYAMARKDHYKWLIKAHQRMIDRWEKSEAKAEKLKKSRRKWISETHRLQEELEAMTKRVKAFERPVEKSTSGGFASKTA